MRRLTIHVRPNAKRARVERVSDSEYLAWVDAPAVDGKANDRLLVLLAEHLHCKRWQLTLLRGQTAKEKTIAYEDAPT
ncbi:MAG: DUF167 domain-containing protein [bacterium]|nr:DUF167 domain-containing protein [bacterium]